MNLVKLHGVYARGQGLASKWSTGDKLFVETLHVPIHPGTINIALRLDDHPCLNAEFPLLGRFQGVDPRTLRNRRQLIWRHVELEGRQAFLVSSVRRETYVHMEVVAGLIGGLEVGMPLQLTVDLDRAPETSTCNPR